MKVFIYILLMTALFFGLGLLVRSLMMIGIVFILQEFDFRTILLLLSSLLSVVGYVGLGMLLADKQNILTLLFLIGGVLGSILYINLQGQQTIDWILISNEFREWLEFVWPVIVTIICIFTLGFKLIKERKKIRYET